MAKNDPDLKTITLLIVLVLTIIPGMNVTWAADDTVSASIQDLLPAPSVTEIPAEDEAVYSSEQELATASTIAEMPDVDESGAGTFYFNYKGSNNNFTIDTQSPLNKRYYTYNYDRLRTDIDTGWEKKVTLKVIFDLENYLGENYIRSEDFQTLINRDLNIPLAPYGETVTGDVDTVRSYLYRAYSTVYLPNSTLTLGFQRIAFGVGRIWNPTDILNPPNPISIEPGERLGVYGAEYVYDLSDLSEAHAFYTLDKDNRTRDWGGRLKTNLKKFDVAVSAIRNEDVKMSGLEIDGELLSTGVGIRTEFAHFESKPLDKEYDKYIFGIDYGFPNSLYINCEYLFNENGKFDKNDYDWEILSLGTWEQLARQYLGITTTYELTPLVVLSGSYIRNLNDASDMFGPQVKWSLADDADLSVGASLFGGEHYTEFWYYKNVYFLSFGIYF
jgi:hypothetical protein